MRKPNRARLDGRCRTAAFVRHRTAGFAQTQQRDGGGPCRRRHDVIPQSNRETPATRDIARATSRSRRDGSVNGELRDRFHLTALEASTGGVPELRWRRLGVAVEGLIRRSRKRPSRCAQGASVRHGRLPRGYLRFDDGRPGRRQTGGLCCAGSGDLAGSVPDTSGGRQADSSLETATLDAPTAGAGKSS